jgi:hypothetical protein
MRGPRYLSLVATDSYWCGGAHPDSSTMALVYDLATGSPVSWGLLLPQALASNTDTDTVGDGTVIGTVSSPALRDLYLKAGMGGSECAGFLPQMDLSFILWPNARDAGITLQPSFLPHVMAACGDELTIPVPTLRNLDVRPELLDAIETAHEKRLYDGERR